METDTGHSSAESASKELHAYAKLLFLRSGCQLEDKTSYRELQSELSSDEPTNDGDSFKNLSLGDLDVDRLRREFLDRLSETVSSAKGGRHVVVIHMLYWPDKVKTFVAMISGASEGDAPSEFLGNLCAALKNIAAAPGSSTGNTLKNQLLLTRTSADNQTVKHTDALWNMLLRHQAWRLNTAIVDLRQIMKSFPHVLPQHIPPESTGNDVLPDVVGVVLDFEDCLKLLANLLFLVIATQVWKDTIAL